MSESKMSKYRYFLKDSIRQTIDFSQTDQSKGVQPPPLEKPRGPDIKPIDLVLNETWPDISKIDLASAIGGRKSHRKFLHQTMSLSEISFLLWATQGIRKKLDAGTAFRNVPSAGCRHALDTYLCVLNVAGLEPGLYRYQPVVHQLVFESRDEQLTEKITAATLGQSFVGRAAVTFIWVAVPYRMEWRYGIAAHKVIALDAGHVCQNLYLASAAIGAGTCAVAAYHQELMDELLGLDGNDEFTVYLAPVGKV